LDDRTDPPARLSVILARSASTGVVFRRGPSRWTLVIAWDTETDRFTQGDWMRGRLYSSRCDLTPNGEYLVYFAASFGGGSGPINFGYSWTAVSRLPGLQPIAVWPKDDCWFGGGLFEDDYHLSLNERSGDRDQGLSLFAVTFDPDAHGEDEPIYARRLDRDGWRVDQEGVTTFDGRRYTTPAPQIRTKAGLRSCSLRVTRAVEGLERIESYVVVCPDQSIVSLEGAEWADFDHAGRLVYARRGCVYTATVSGGTVEEQLLADLNQVSSPPALKVRRS
jgi:hypothetical protein